MSDARLASVIPGADSGTDPETDAPQSQICPPCAKVTREAGREIRQSLFTGM